MLYSLITLLSIIITIVFVVGTHEFGHFIVARLLGVKVLRFSIGFGRILFARRDKSGTEYAFSLIPLGGYVKMLDENEGDVPKKELPFAYNRQPFYKKFLIILAGPITNFLCAFFLYWLLFVVGFVTVKPIIGDVIPHSIAANAGLKKNQEIIGVDAQTTNNWTHVLFRLLTHAGNKDQITIEVKNADAQKQQNYSLDVMDWKLDPLTPDPLKSLGIVPYQPEVPLIVGVIAADSPAASSPLKMGDKIIAVDKKPIKDWLELITLINNSPDKVLDFTVERNNKKINLPIKTGYHRNLFLQKLGYLGIAPHFEWPKNLTQKIQYGPLTAITHAWHEVIDYSYFNLLLLGKMLIGKVSIQSLGGPITIFESAGSALNYGFIAFAGFLAFISISIGIINLLPIPGLDGGHLFIQFIEFIIRRPVPEKLIVLLYQLGFVFLFFILFQALINDVLRI